MFATKKCQIVGQVKCLRSYVILCNFKNWICEWKLHDIGWNTEQFRSSFQTSRCTGPCDNLYLLLLSGLGSLSIYWFVLLPQGQSCFTRFKIWKISLDTIHFQYSRLISWKADWINKRWTSQGKLGKQRLLTKLSAVIVSRACNITLCDFHEVSPLGSSFMFGSDNCLERGSNARHCG